MIEIGRINTLEIKRESPHGLFLTDGTAEILLPGKFIPEDWQAGDLIEVFCYLDHERRPVATTQDPLITRDSFAYLQVAELTEYGAFMDWGLDKHLLAPFREQSGKMQAGASYVVYCYLDEKSGRLVASSRVERFLDKEKAEFRTGEGVEVLCYRETELGYEVIVNGRHKGLVFRDQVHRSFGPGTHCGAFVKKVRKDGKLDIVLEPVGHRKLEPAAERILKALEEAGGSLPLHDKSDPEAIKKVLKMSKKLFKKGVGILYRQGKIDLGDSGIRLRA